MPQTGISPRRHTELALGAAAEVDRREQRQRGAHEAGGVALKMKNCSQSSLKPP